MRAMQEWRRGTVGLCSLAMVLAGLSIGASAPGPRLSGSGPVGDAALRVARASYASGAADPARWPVLPTELAAGIRLREVAAGEAFEDSVWFDPGEFARIEFNEPGPAPTLYYQIRSMHRRRLALIEEPLNSRLTRYSLFAAPETLGSAGVEWEFRRGKSGTRLTRIVDASWRVPLIFRDDATGSEWLIDLGGPETPLADWRVFAVTEDGVRKAGTIVMRPSGDPKRALPAPVRELAGALDQALGHPDDEGTFHATAWLRQDLSVLWADVALRPWAIADTYRTRAEADSELARWGREGGTRGDSARRVQRALDPAARALTDFYVATFARNRDEAETLARFALDVAYRSYFRHPANEAQESPGGGTSNPWTGTTLTWTSTRVQSVVLDQPADGRRVDLNAGDTLEVDLRANVTTGHAWRTTVGPTGVLQPAGAQYDADAHPPGMVGFGGTSRHWFVATRAGTDSIRFSYVGPGNLESGAVRLFVTVARPSNTKVRRSDSSHPSGE